MIFFFFTFILIENVVSVVADIVVTIIIVVVISVLVTVAVVVWLYCSSEKGLSLKARPGIDCYVCIESKCAVITSLKKKRGFAKKRLGNY